jgi:hypothetical protein
LFLAEKEVKIMKPLKFFGVFGILTLSLFQSVSLAQNRPSLTGTWEGIVSGGYRMGDLELTQDESKPKNATGTERRMVIARQEGSGFTGSWGLNDNKESLLGVIRADQKTILMVDDDTNFIGTLLSDDTMEMCVQEHGAAQIAVCVLMKKVQ